ncbi:MAG: DUF488 domain-containing protein [Rhodospirillales bacterium]|nr:DUF488 domain-containing protein [Rhodospirillales bacterium]
MKRILTIGYEGAAIEDFCATLKAAAVRTLVDVRAIPVSRKRGFSKTSLAQACAEAGIAYLHLSALGNPKPGREAAKRGDREAFRRIYREHLEGQVAQAGLVAALEVASGSTELLMGAPACLLCFERDPADCHRAIVACEMARRGGLSICHASVRQGLAATVGRQAHGLPAQ